MRLPYWLIVLVGLAGCNPPLPSVPTVTHQPSQTKREIEHIQVGNVTYEYVVITPQQCMGHPSPVVIALHGRGGNWQAAVADFGLVSEAESKGFILIAPSAQEGQWHDLDRDPAQKIDFSFFTQLFDKIPSYGGDKSRIYVTGFSNGGGEAFTLGANFSDRIAAIGSGGASTGALDGRLVYHTLPHPKRKIPVIMFHGMQDELSGYDMRTFAVPIPDAALWWAKEEGANLKPAHSETGHGLVLVDSYTGNGADITLLSYKDLGHAWPTVVDRQTGLEFNDMLWDFLSRHTV
jgi:polyhydroxybutyrate depolymerase